MTEQTIERRSRQRIVAKRWGAPTFWAVVDGRRLPLEDLSLDGFAIPVSTPPAAARLLQVTLQRTAGTDEVHATAQVMSFTREVAGGQAGCKFVSFEGDGAALLRRWLVDHVLAVATVPITPDEADAIVRGRSIV